MSKNEAADAEYMVLQDLDATHDRRVHLLLKFTSAILIVLGMGIFLAFAAQERWVNCLFELPIPLMGLAGALLTWRGHIRAASLLLIVSAYLMFSAIALFGDGPTAQIPRVTHLCLIPVAFGSFIALKKEAAWIRHSFVLICLATTVLFATTNVTIDVGLYLPDPLHRVVDWVISLGAISVLYLLMTIYMGDVGRMENYLHLANNRLVSLLSGMFPKKIAERLLTQRQTFAERYQNCSVLFADIVGFTHLTERMAPESMIAMLSEVFLRFDRCVEAFGLTKIKTIGDAYMVAAGVPEADPDHARKMMEFALQILDVVKEFPDIEIRVGIASGELVAGVIGQSRQVFDVWGDVVNLASRIESQGLQNQIQVSATTYALTRHAFNFSERSGISIKGKSGTHNVYVYTSRANELAPAC